MNISNIQSSDLAFDLLIKTQKLTEAVNNHFIENVLKPTLHPYANLETVKFKKYYKGVVDVFYASTELPNIDNFYYPQELFIHYTKSNNAPSALPIEYLPNLLPSVPINVSINLRHYKKFKLEKVFMHHEISSTFKQFGIFDDEINISTNSQTPKHMCLLLFSNFSTKTKSFFEEELSEQKYYTIQLLVYFPVHKNVEKRYACIIDKESSYSEKDKNLVIEITAHYSLDCETILL